ncbi:hypothetical protein NADFUDRAFT_46039 [Nadsonia fulvescens var. elongata DSM 6958]|uniref:very-long-chain enoyl-CoA reductase n=1 Tax=Nadsonia fulvescens var. elongata DSM 6958 TaxID=857566 RepID=A0A1E3PMG6_9ASCO|nr:hypothetical protein NADFUDRAFT_46039 [Nadsonia fulvescens var. elongata DSM 6958]
MVLILLKNKSARSKISNLPSSVEVDLSANCSAIAESISAKTGLDVNRIRLTIPSKEDDKPVSTSEKKKKDTVLISHQPVQDFISQPETTVSVKDLGPQIGWKTVFMIEYFGPLWIHPLFYFAQQLIYGQTFKHTRVQYVAFLIVLLHFIKREYETIAVHRFSLATMPLINVFKNSFHYWIFSGFNLAYFIYSPSTYSDASAPIWKKILFSQSLFTLSDTTINVLILVWGFAEVSNLITHLNFSSLRSDGSKDRKIPYGYGFSLVSCPNYFFEILGWVVFAVLTQNWSAVLFATVSFFQMFVWAVKKHKQYRRQFGDKYPKNRKIMIPFFL